MALIILTSITNLVVTFSRSLMTAGSFIVIWRSWLAPSVLGPKERGSVNSGGKPETWKWFRLKGVRNPSGKV